MANAADPFLKAVYNGRQLALKVSANSVYGEQTGATGQGRAGLCGALAGRVHGCIQHCDRGAVC